MMKKAYKLTFQNGKNRLVEDDAPLEHLRAVCLNRYLSDGSGELSLCKAVEEVLDQQMALRVLDEMDALRRKQWYHLPPPLRLLPACYGGHRRQGRRLCEPHGLDRLSQKRRREPVLPGSGGPGKTICF